MVCAGSGMVWENLTRGIPVLNATVSQSDEEVETDFDSDSDYSESEKVPKQNKIQGKYPFLQNHPLY